jgi:hypothetical protein
MIMSTPISFTYDFNIPAGVANGSAQVNTSSNKVVTLRYVSGFIWVPSGQGVDAYVVSDTFQWDPTTGTTQSFQYFPMTFQCIGALQHATFGTYLGCGTIGGPIEIRVDRSDTTGVLFGRVTVVGDLDDAP